MVRTIIDIDEDLLRQVMAYSKGRTVEDTVAGALNEYLRLKKRQKLFALIGNYGIFNLTWNSYHKMRPKR